MTNKQIRDKITKLRKQLTTKPRGKPKGGAYEREVGRMIAHAFRKHDITNDDWNRTPRGSPIGDLKFSSALAKLFPFTVEAKFYKSVPSLHMLRTFEDMEASWPWKKWWIQLEAETAITKKSGLLVFRENNGLNLCSFYVKDMAGFRWSRFKWETVPKFITYKEGKEIWTIRFDTLLKKFMKQ